MHSTQHDITDPIVLSNGILRVRLDEDRAPNITAERWDESAGTWTAVDAVETEGASTDWQLYDIDITQVQMQDVRLQLGFEHPSEGLVNLNASLQVERDAVLFWSPSSEGSVPSEIETWLEPVAADWLADPQPERTLVDRKDLR